MIHFFRRLHQSPSENGQINREYIVRRVRWLRSRKLANERKGVYKMAIDVEIDTG
jgi:hypothetical protein